MLYVIFNALLLCRFSQ